MLILAKAYTRPGRRILRYRAMGVRSQAFIFMLRIGDKNCKVISVAWRYSVPLPFIGSSLWSNGRL